jgi:hypothetical protein
VSFLRMQESHSILFYLNVTDTCIRRYDSLAATAEVPEGTGGIKIIIIFTEEKIPLQGLNYHNF